MTEDMQALIREVTRVPVPDQWDDIQTREPRPTPPSPPSPHRLATIALALAIALASLALVRQVFRVGPASVPSVTSTPTPSLTGTPRITGEVKMPQNTIAGNLAVGAGSVWVEAWPTKDGDTSLLRIDQITDEVVATLPVKMGNLAATDSAVWVSEGRTVKRIDPNTDSMVAAVPVPGEVSSIAATSADVWLIAIADSSEGSLIRIDQGTNNVVAAIPLGPQFTGYEDQLVAGPDAVWALGVRWNGKDQDSAEYGGELVRVDPTTNQVVARVPVDGFRMAVGDDAVWVKFPSDGVFDSSDEKWLWTKVDVSTNEPSIPFPMDTGAVQLVTPNGLWSVDYDDSEHVRVTRFDPTSHEVVARSQAIPSYFEGAIIDPSTGTVWISTFDTVTRVDISGSSAES